MPPRRSSADQSAALRRQGSSVRIGPARHRNGRCCWSGWHPVSKIGEGREALGFEPSTFRVTEMARWSSGTTAAPHAADAGSSPARVTSGRSCAPRSVLQAQGLRWTTHKESRHALPPGHDVIQCASLRSSSAVERVAVTHRRRRFESPLRSSWHQRRVPLLRPWSNGTTAPRHGADGSSTLPGRTTEVLKL